jgi:transposase-like protein
MAKTYTLATLTAAGATAGTTGTTTNVGIWRRAVVVLDITTAATVAGDTLDMYADVSPDRSTWLNAVRFTQVLGNGGAKRYAAVLDPSNPGTSILDVSARLGSAGVRPALFGPWMRAYYVITSSSAPAFTGSLTVLVE